MTTPAHPVETHALVRPAQANHRGTLFAGEGLARLAEAAFLAARGHAGRDVVMAAVRGVDFTAPVPVGHRLVLRAWVSRVGRSSMTVCVDGVAEAPGAPADAVLKAVFELVAVDAAGRPAAIDPSCLDNQETSA